MSNDVNNVITTQTLLNVHTVNVSIISTKYLYFYFCIFKRNRLLQKKNQREIEQAQFKFNDVYHALESLTDVYNQLHTQNNTSTTKVLNLVIGTINF